MNDRPSPALRLLVVDDDVGQADMLLEFLRLSGFNQLDLVETIRDLWRKLKEKGSDAYDIILLDYMLPDGTGLDVLKQLSERGNQIPVIMVTGHGSERVAAQAIQSGAADYLIKSGDYLLTIPALIQKTLDAQELKLSMQRSVQALRESEARYRAIVEDYQTELICRFRPDGSLTFVNEVYCRYFQRQRDELLGMNFLYFIPEEQRPALIQHLASFNASRHAATIEHEVILDEGQLLQPQRQQARWLQRTDRAIIDDQGRIFEFQSMARDITERKRMEMQLRAAQAHLVQAARLATIGEMAAGVAHQIYNPLTTIIADAQILLRSLPAEGSKGAPGERPIENKSGKLETARESAQAIEQAGWRLQQVVQRLMEFSRPTEEARETMQINETIQHALSLVRPHLEEIGCRIETRLADDLPPMQGNRRQIENLWVYLLLLARDACRQACAAPEGKRILLSTLAGPGSFVLVEIRDNGLPIPEGQSAVIFEPNFVGPSSGRGTGMELSICREIVRQHGGQITADRATDEHIPTVHDTIIRVALPVEKAAAV